MFSIFEKIDSIRRHMLKTVFSIIAIACSFTIAKSQYLVDSEFLGTTDAMFLGFVPGIPTEYDVDYYKLTYNTTDANGNETVASGGIAIPISEECNEFPIMAYCHGTVLRRYDVPSADNSEAFIAKVFSSTGYIAIAPDYIGLGDNEGIHPYVHDESQATATLDLKRATDEFLETISATSNGEFFITGYSQGGQAAMGSAKYAQENGMVEELGLTAAAPCSGPYNISGSQADVLLSDQPYSNPGYVVYLLISYQLAYGNLYNDLSDILQSPYDTEVLPYFDGEQNEYDMGVVNAILPGSLSELLVDSVLTNFTNNPNHPLRQALEDNDNYDWVPEFPVRMYYCTGDEQVDFSNSTFTDTWMNENGAADVDAINSLEGASHGGCVIPALGDVYSFFSEIATPCNSSVNVDKYQLEKLTLYPNPASSTCNVLVPAQTGRLIVQDIYGRVLFKTNIYQETTEIDLSSFPAGQYIVTVESEKTIWRNGLIVQ